MPSAFVTGGTGFVGSHLVEELLARGFDEVRCLVRTELRWLEGLPVTIVRGSLADPRSMMPALRDVDVVFHVAALTRSRRWSDFESANVAGTTGLLDALAERDAPPARVVVTSSLAAVGRCDRPVADESVPLRPVSLYGRSKAEMEARVEAYGDRLPIVVIRPPSVYGPRDDDILTFFRSVARGLCPIVGRGDLPSLSLVHVSDLVRGMADASIHPATVGRTYFVGDNEPTRWNDLRDAAAAALGRRVLTLRIPPSLVGAVGGASELAGRFAGVYPPLNREKAREIRHACAMCSSGRARREFGYEPRVGLEEGIRSTIEWYRAAGWIRA